MIKGRIICFIKLTTVGADVLYKQFQSVFEQYYGPLCKYALSFVKERDASEDIVQEVFARIWETRQDLVSSDVIRFYLFTSVRNNCLTYLRQEQRLPTYSLSELEIEDVDDIVIKAEEHIPGEATNYRTLLRKGIETLPPKCKEVFLLCRLGDLNNQEVANSLGISVKTVSNQLWKAIKILKAFAKNAP